MMAAELHVLAKREPAASADGCTVLIADDDDIVCAHLAELISAAGYSVRLASTGVEALQVLDSEPVHIVISDWEMPDMDGLELCRRIRSRPTEIYTYVVMLTIRRSHDDVVAGLTAGADDYVIKGAEVAELLARVHVGRRIVTLERSLREATRESQRLAMTDALTGALNRRYLMTNLPREIEHSRRHGHPVSLLVCDLDHFKRINDQFGHKAGDQVLEDFRARCSATIRAADWIARTGGEEFVIVLPETDLHGAAAVAESVRQAVCAHPVAAIAGAIPMTVSIGYSGLCGDQDFAMWQGEDLLRAADKQLYVAKSAGRNCCAGASMQDTLG
jgi:two-component system, cell cycle response regulator